ncbi:HCP-like superfamily protein with MYND-type zinc finger [Rhynchospora pubera]|uniref:HCP-like superfamily protein with MYND-type zinc finger n=1 Tax=Rhynchospora pubera TaxID=906938 RepID=A0AAV8DNL2_9POAL|nr:HCP-like superfamily protein with MYND-type zinc finger [Rhynchospora pubera]
MATTTAINTLPKDMIVEIAAALVSSSPLPFTDLMSFKNSCKVFFEATNDRLVKLRIVLHREFPDLNWKASDWRMTIFKACAEAGNPQACFILALTYIFGDRDICSGVKLLHKAASKGHKEALYLMNIVKLRVQDHPPLANMLPPGVFTSIESIKFDDNDVQWCRRKVVHVYEQVTWNDWRVTNVTNRHCCESSSESWFGRWNDRHRSFCSEACRWNQKFIELCLGT